MQTKKYRLSLFIHATEDCPTIQCIDATSHYTHNLNITQNAETEKSVCLKIVTRF